MPASIVNVATGGINATSGNVTLPATTAGNTVLVAFGNYTRSMATTAGFVIDSSSSVGTTRVQLFRRSNVPAGETTWAFTTAVANACAWVAVEVEGLDNASPVDVIVATVSNVTSGTSITTNTTPTSTVYDGFVLGLVGASISGTTPGTLSSWTGGFAEVAQSGQAGPVNSATVSLAQLDTQQLTTFAGSATHSAALSASFPGAGWAIVYAAAGAKRAANVQAMFGAECALAAGLATGTAGSLVFESIGGTPAVVTTAPRSGAYCLELSATAAAEYGQWAGTGSGNFGATSNFAVARFCIYFPSSLPSGDVDLFNFATASGTVTTLQAVTLRYRTASQQLGLQVRQATAAVDGTEQLSATTVAADTWYGIDVRYDGSSTATLTADWQVDGVDQTQATVATTTSQGLGAMSVGWLAASTATVRYDDIVLSRTVGHYPLGDFRILPLKPDPAGTLTISGTTANFNTFASNGTMTAWNAATALAAIDDLPPTIGASADGIAQVTLAASDYVNIPMETYDAAANGSAIRAVRMYACGWAASATAATLGFRGYEGTTETTLMATADPEFDNSTTTPAWVAKMFKPTGGWTQTKLDNLAFRVGFSSDATPDIGIHAIMAEVAVRTGELQTLAGDLASAVLDPDTAGVVSLSVTAPQGGDGSLYYETNTTPTTVPVPAGTTVTTTIDAPDAATTNYIAWYPPPEPYTG